MFVAFFVCFVAKLQIFVFFVARRTTR